MIVMISFFMKRCLLLRVPILWPKCKYFGNRILPAMFGASLGFSVKAVSESLDEPKLMESLTDKSLIQNATSVTATSVNQLLVLSAAILVQHHENYRKAIEHLLLLMEHISIFMKSESHQEELWTEMVSVRAKLEDSKKALIEMESFLEYIEKLVTATVEASYIAESELCSTTLCEALNSVLQKVNLQGKMEHLLPLYEEIQFQQTKTKELEAEYQAQQQAFVEIMGKEEKTSNSKE